MTSDKQPSLALLAGCTVVLAVAVILALLPLTNSGVDLSAGDIAFRTVRAPRDISFQSSTLTAQRQDEAAKAVPETLVYDPSVAVRQQSALGNVLDRIAGIRIDASLSPQAKQTALSRIDTVSLSPRSSALALNQPDAAFQAVSSEARRALGAVLSQSLPPNATATTREQALTYVDLGLDRDTASLVAEIMRPFVVANLTVDAARTEAARTAARAAVAPVQVSYAKGQTIVERDTPVSAEAREALVQGHLVQERWKPDILGAIAALAGITSLGVVATARSFRPAAFSNPPQLLLIALAIAVPVFVMKMYLPLILPDDNRHFLAFAMPVATAAIVLGSVLGPELALTGSIATTLLVGFAAVYLSDLTVVGLVGTVDTVRLALTAGFAGVAGILAVRGADRFSHFLLGGLAVGAAVMVALAATWLIDPSRQTKDLAWMAAAATANGSLSAFLGLGIFVTLGALFGITTRVQLLEMSQLSQPLLRRLQDEAPATFQHSVIVANLAEKGAYVIGADALLARVGCYYHDIGKLMRPGFFIENQFGGPNPHDGLVPTDSAGIIVDHVNAGLALARQHRLPGKVAAFIPEHHGTRLVSYFYRQAAAEDAAVAPDAFRYPGPKPQSRETAIAMLADSTEAVIRASTEHTSERISELIDEVFAERLAEGQLDESDLTLRNLRALAESFKATMRAVYHPRVEYPAPTAAELRLRRRLALPRLMDRR